MALTTPFDRFWAAYPPRPENPKKPARDQFDRLLKAGFAADDLVRAAEAYGAFVRQAKKDLTFVPHARTWLCQRRFEDYLEGSDEKADGPLDAPAEAHPLAWLQPMVGSEAWASWISPLQADVSVRPVVITARTGFALSRVMRDYGAEIRARYGEPDWRVAERQAP